MTNFRPSYLDPARIRLPIRDTRSDVVTTLTPVHRSSAPLITNLVYENDVIEIVAQLSSGYQVVKR